MRGNSFMRFMPKYRPWMVISFLLILLIFSNGFWAYAVFDQAVTLSYKRDVIDWCTKGRKTLNGILEVALYQDLKSKTKEELLALFPGSFWKKDPALNPELGEGYVVVREHLFWFKDGKLTAIEDGFTYHITQIQ